MKTTLIIFLSLLLAAPALAQGVYVTEGKNGPVYSDKPQAGARELTLPPLNVVDPPPVPAKTQQPSPPAAGAPAKPPAAAAELVAYRTFAIVWPEDDGSVLANTAIFEVRVAVDPPLQLGARHAYAVSVNGRPVDARFTAEEFMIPPEFWGDELPPPNQLMQLDASIVDGDGRVLKSAAPVRFYLRHATLNQQRRPVPRPVK